MYNYKNEFIPGNESLVASVTVMGVAVAAVTLDSVAHTSTVPPPSETLATAGTDTVTTACMHEVIIYTATLNILC